MSEEVAVMKFNASNVYGVGAVLALAVLAGCASVPEGQGAAHKETLHVLTQKMELLTINVGQPDKVLQRTLVTGALTGETLVGMDYRVSKGMLFALSSAGRLYTLDVPTGVLTVVGSVAGVALQGSSFGVDFNPVADRVRVVSASGQNLRLHPDTGALVATDTPLSYAPGDPQAGQQPEVVAAGYTYNKKDDKLTTNYAIDRRAGMLVTQGSVEGVQPVVSPNTGQLRTVGPLGTGPLLDASLDIADVSGIAFAAVRSTSHPTTKLYTVDLSSGKATLVGTLADGAPILGLAVEP
ncbi:DUF4394 domain-containing protein [Rhodoferax saidenbachensis]|uniref:DUF4394 domain-containing protein n=1 Tax=Rhodoferax saidenbachensis TaxID=1484693 RepID=A0ABU1ZSC0_9BURK|nr:DUF4394 domain-containing protein [Rhodoferax saidenbachensis]MDR7308430.1 hypothetical protein [Rhodoferax saidenbachensis]